MMTGENRTSVDNENEAAAGGGIDKRRRRITVAASSSPVLLALWNRPVFGRSCPTDTPSGFESANASGKLGDRCDYELGRSPGYWGNNGNGGGTWPQGTGKNDSFHSVFGSVNHFTLPSDMADDELTLGQVVGAQKLNWGQDGYDDPLNLGRAFVAAYLNAKAFGPAYPVTVQRVLDMWTDVDSGSGHEVSSGIVWDKSDMKTYLESTYHGSADD